MWWVQGIVCRKRVLKEVLHIHTGEKPFVYKDCQKAFTPKSAITVYHTFIVKQNSNVSQFEKKKKFYLTKEKNFVCEFCRALLPQYKSVILHINFTQYKSLLWMSKPLWTERVLKTASWAGEKTFICIEYQKAFVSESALKNTFICILEKICCCAMFLNNYFY